MTGTNVSSSALILENVHLASNLSSRTGETVYTVKCRDGEEFHVLDGRGGILVPSLCHSHIHLDKCNILGQCDELVTGNFKEAMVVTSKAKESYTSADLFERGRKLILESVKYGVTAIRAHVEVDRIVGFKCVEVGLKLREDFSHICDVGLSVFAQDPVFYTTGEETENLRLLKQAASLPGISTVGSAPYVEANADLIRRNIDAIFDIAIKNDLHIDFHLDFNLNRDIEPFTPYVIEQARRVQWNQYAPNKRITIGHASRLGMLSKDQLNALSADIGDLPITIISLPQTDTYMLGPGAPLNVLELTSGLDMAMSVNNVGNAFTPQGSFDPLNLCTFGVATFQNGTPNACATLLDSVSNVSKRAAGMNHPRSLLVQKGDPADLVLIHGCSNVQDLVLSPSYERTTIKAGRVVASRTITDFVAET
ncbi:hypothetical protein M422DRAFT_58789 [Sphaerobolus stellatus SS14]|nr:hypothetical protein M422DRAFT_58789 [Sphaerobolus stellatus SS14]